MPNEKNKPRNNNVKQQEKRSKEEAPNCFGFPSETTRFHGPPLHLGDSGRNWILGDKFWVYYYHGKNDIVFERDEQKFYEYCDFDGRWKEVPLPTIKGRLGGFIMEEAERPEAETIAAPLRRFASQNSVLSSLADMLKTPAIRQNAFSKESQNYYMHMLNGILYIRRDGTVTFKPEFDRKLMSRNQLQVRYDPEADCPMFKEKLLGAAVNPEDFTLLQMWAGMVMLNRNIAQRMLILLGKGKGGKSTFIKTIQHLIGRGNHVKLNTHLLDSTFELYRYVGKSLLCGVDVPGDFLLFKGAQQLKSLTGGDYFDSQAKMSNEIVQMEGTYNVAICSNENLSVLTDGEDNSSWERRLLIVRFNDPAPDRERIPEFDKLLFEKEASGILNWALQGLQRLCLHLEVNHEEWPLTRNQHERIKSLLNESESFPNFLKDSIQNSQHGQILKSDILPAYYKYCSALGFAKWKEKRISASLEKLMMELFNVNETHSCGPSEKSRGFRHVSWKVKLQLSTPTVILPSGLQSIGGLTDPTLNGAGLNGSNSSCADSQAQVSRLSKHEEYEQRLVRN